MKKLFFLLFVISFCFGYTGTSSDVKASPAKIQLVMETVEVQKVLKALGYQCVVNGALDDVSVRAIRKFQADHHLDVDGIVGVNTQEQLLKEFVCSAMPEIKNYRSSLDIKNLISVKWYPDSSAKDPYYKNFYHIYVGTNQKDHTTVWSRFMVRKDFEKVLRDNHTESNGERYYTLYKW